MNSQVILCPRCKQNGHIVRMRIVGTNEVIYICDECDEMWPENTEFTLDNSVFFGTYMQSIGRKGLWSELEEVNE